MAATVKTEPAATHVQARDAASGDIKGEVFVIAAGEIFEATHPIVRKHPHLFRPLEQSRDRPAVEQATAAPGERRGVAHG